MNNDLIEAQYISDYSIRLKFRDGTTGEIDLTPVLWGPVFEPLRDPEQFKQFRIDEDFHTLVWPNGADLAPEFLYNNVRVTA
jgi:hypothetical protein